MTEQLLEQVALRIRHNAAMEVVQTVATAEQRISLLADVIWPRPRFYAASRQAAVTLIARREKAA